ncbi:MAG: hypothetical protein ABID40_02795 [Candidatus Bipolaricaulota bacterium]
MVIVLTGRMGSGRTTVAQYLQQAFGFRRTDRIPKTDAGLVVVDGPEFALDPAGGLVGGTRVLRRAQQVNLHWWTIVPYGFVGETSSWRVSWRRTREPNPERVARAVDRTLALMLVNSERDKLKARRAPRSS